MSDESTEVRPRLYIRKKKPVKLAFLHGNYELAWLIFIVGTGLPAVFVTSLAGYGHIGGIYFVGMVIFYFVAIRMVFPGSKRTLLALIYRKCSKWYHGYVGDTIHLSNEPERGERFTRKDFENSKNRGES